MPEVIAPMFISSRLMAAIKIDNNGHPLDPPGGTVHVEVRYRKPDGRIAYSCVIEDDNRTVLYEGDGINSGVGGEPDFAEAMASTLHFIAHSGDQYRQTMDKDTPPEDGWTFNGDVAEWAYQNYDTITILAIELEESAH